VADPRQRIEARLAESNAGPRIPGVALGLVQDGRELVIAQGITNAEHPLPVDARTLFQIASLTKPFTATALLRLVDEGRVDLAAPVTKYLPTFRLAVPEWTERVRVQDLLTHVGGWLGDHFFMTPPSRPSLEALVDEFASAPQLFEPGTAWSYDNAGFSVAGRILEGVTGEPFAKALRELVLAPLGLSHTFLRADEVVTHRVAAPHVVGPQGPVVLRGGGWQPGWELQAFDAPAGGLVSCIADLLVWARFQLGDGRAADGARVLRAETLARMHTETRAAGCDDDAVGLGWLLHDRGGVRFSGHGGQTAGYLSKIAIHRERRFGLAILTNAVRDGGLRRDLERFVLGECLGVEPVDPVPLADPGGLAPFEGCYDHPFALQHVRPGEGDGELVLESEARPHDPRRWQPPPPPPLRYRFYARDRLVAVAPAEAAGARAEFGRDAQGKVAWLRQGGRIAPRLPQAPGAPARAAS
jgi:CubicO group peptidase (beta-lactamase class C family)